MGDIVRQTVECEAIVFDLDVLASGSDDGSAAEPTAGSGFLLSHLPAGRWAIVTSGTAPVARRRLESANLPVPSVLIATDVAPVAADLERAAESIGADPSFSVVVAGCLATLDAAASHAGVIAVAGAAETERLRGAHHVVPSLSSLRVLGQHPVLVLEVDIIPDL